MTITNIIAVVAIVAGLLSPFAVLWWRGRRAARGALTAAETAELMDCLRWGEDIVVEFGDTGVLTAKQMDDLRIGDLIRGTRRIAGRGDTPVYRAAADLADAAAGVRRAAMPEDREIIAAYSGAAPAPAQPRDLARMGIAQERAVRSLSDRIAATWRMLRRR